jgi:hypothetical protein
MNSVRRSFRLIDPGEWAGEETGRPRVLVEHPDHAVLQSAADTLRDEGYDVATCSGPTQGARCPHVEFGYCPLADEADVVVSSTRLGDAQELLAAYAHDRRASLVVEIDPDDADEAAKLVSRAILLTAPITPERLLGAVAEARARGTRGRGETAD